MDTKEFLDFVITCKQGGWLPICASAPNGTAWRQYWRAWPDDADNAVALIEGLRDESMNVYFSAHLFSEKETKKEYVMETRTVFVDLDDAEVHSIPLRPSMLVKSSDTRHQGYWILDDWLPIEQFEALSYRATYGIENADHSGWYAGHIMRVSNTINHKYDPPQRVRVVSHNKSVYSISDFNAFPTSAASKSKVLCEVTDEWIEQALKVPARYPSVHDVWDEYRTKVIKGTDVYMYTRSLDRSRALWRLTTELFRAGATREQVYLLAYHSANNKFDELRYNGTRELAKDVLRAEREVLHGPAGMRLRVNDTRRIPGTPTERKQALAEICRNQMMSHGAFIHARGGTLWYIPTMEGKPIPISKYSTQLNVLLENMFGLNPTESEHAYVVGHLINFIANMPALGEVTALSHYLKNDNVLLLHTGKKDVIRITSETIDTVTNGFKNIIFPWSDEGEFTPNMDADSNTWADTVFANCFDNLAIGGITPEHAQALLHAWFLALIFREDMIARPIIALFGPQGSGKSTLFRRIYVLMYGPRKAVSGITTADDFDFSLAKYPLVVIDNVDTWEKWLPDRIARAAAPSEITKRKLYTDTDMITMRTQAFLAITAHNPKFGREDVTDRLLIINLERLMPSKRLREEDIINNIDSLRDNLWGSIVWEIQKVLQEPRPDKVPEFRVADFAHTGQRIANALGFGDAFYDGLTSIVGQQNDFLLDEDSMLVDLIDKYTTSTKFRKDEWKTPQQFWAICDVLAGTDRNFSKQYGNSVKLGKKLWTMMTALKQQFNVEWKLDSVKHTRVWRITRKEEENVG